MMLKRFLINFSLIFSPILLIGTAYYYKEVAHRTVILEMQMIESLKGHNEHVIDEFTHIISDLMFLSDQYQLQQLLNNDTTQQRQILATEYRQFLSRKKIYDQVRFLDNTGMEIVRANFNADNPVTVPNEKLQNKGNRYYFRDTFKLNQEEVFVSPFDLNIEQGKIEQPLKPMIRFGTPVLDQNGKKRGIILINYLGSYLLRNLYEKITNNHIMLLNKNGFWLKGIDKQDEWGFMYPNRQNRTLKQTFPKEWKIMSAKDSGQFHTNNGLFTFTTLYPLSESHKSSTATSTSFHIKDRDYYWETVSYVPKHILQTRFKQILANIMIPFIALFIIIVIISFFFSRVQVKHDLAKKELLESEERFKTIVKAIPIPMVISRLVDSTILYANKHYVNSFNISSMELIKHKLHQDICNKSDKRYLLNVLKKKGRGHNLELQVKKQGGEIFWIAVSFRHIIFKAEPAIISVAYDITEQKQAVEKIQQQHKFLQQVMDSLDHPFYVINADTYEIELANSALKNFGVHPHSKCYQITHHLDTPCIGGNDPCPLKMVKETKKSVVLEHIHFDDQGNPINVEVHGFPIKDATGRITKMIEYSLNITERKKSEKLLQEQNEELHTQNEQLDAFSTRLEELQEQKLYQINKAYERFVPQQFLSFLNKKSILEVELGNQVAKEMTILFADIRDFTTLSEKMSPQDNFDFLNSYLGYMEPAITQCNGFIDKYIGDGIMALFPTNADDAVNGAIAMLKALKKYNEYRQKYNYPAISIGIGLNTGPLILGTIGAKERMDSTVISDAVNLAARVEQLTKFYGTPILITEHTCNKLIDPNEYKIRVIDITKVKGKSERVTVYEIFDVDSLESIALKTKTLTYFKQGFALYHCSQFKNAQEFFKTIVEINPNDKVASAYLQRCQRKQTK
ncbi:MAG: PAS domain S-box protein [Thiomargarita sp.]|nr:PAS domain S-box protein [Thiomargarita sp.]